MSKNQNVDFMHPTTRDKIDRFEQLDGQFKGKLQAIFDKMGEELRALDELREERNDALDQAERAIRQDATQADYTKVSSISYHGFKAQKRYSEWFVPETFEALLKNRNLLNAAIEIGAIEYKTEVNGKLAEAFLKQKSLEKEFKSAMDGKELTPAVYGPKPIPPLGSETKK